MTIDVSESDAPAHWASYLINGDASGMTDDEQAECDQWLTGLDGWSVVSCSDEQFFGRFHFAVEGKTLGCDLLTYSLLK